MSFFSNLFGKNKKEEPKEEPKQEVIPSRDNTLPWIEPAANPYRKRLLDLRPISQTMISTSQDPKMAENAISYSGEDGRCFWEEKPANSRTIDATLTIPVDSSLEPGVLYIPREMEQKWAIYFDGTNIIVVRSWLREVFVTAKTSQKNNLLFIESITGTFTPGETPEFTTAVLNFLLISHCIGTIIPAPLPKRFEATTKDAGLWSFSTYGNMAHIGIFEDTFIPVTTEKLRSHSLLHIAIAKGNMADIEQMIARGASVNLLAGDGLSTLHWAIANNDTEPLQKLLELGANPDVSTPEGATPIMNAAQSNKAEHLLLLLNSGASVNAKDHRGFTALHRAAEMNHIEIVKLLLKHGADKTIEAIGHTPLSLANARGNKEVIQLLS